MRKTGFSEILLKEQKKILLLPSTDSDTFPCCYRKGQIIEGLQIQMADLQQRRRRPLPGTRGRNRDIVREEAAHSILVMAVCHLYVMAIVNKETPVTAVGKILVGKADKQNGKLMPRHLFQKLFHSRKLAFA